MRTNLVLGVDIGGTKVALLLARARDGAAVGRVRSFETQAPISPRRLLGAIQAEAALHARELGHDPKHITAIGLSVPGQVDARGVVLHAGNLGWRRAPLRRLAAERLRIPAFVEHDASAGALGERWRGAARKMETFVFLALGTGVGGGVIIDGHVHRGAHGFAGEVGDFVMSREHLRRSEREAHQNLAAVIGGRTIRRRARAASGQNLSAAAAISRGQDDPELAPLAADVADYLAMAVINITALLDPEAIVFGGGTAEAGEDLIAEVREKVSRELADLVRPPRLLAARLGTEAQLHGALWGALHALAGRSQRSHRRLR